jgi:hypothetical protein
MWSAAHFFLQNGDGEIVGGALGNIWGDWYFLDVLWLVASVANVGRIFMRATVSARFHLPRFSILERGVVGGARSIG